MPFDILYTNQFKDQLLLVQLLELDAGQTLWPLMTVMIGIRIRAVGTCGIATGTNGGTAIAAAAANGAASLIMTMLIMLMVMTVIVMIMMMLRLILILSSNDTANILQIAATPRRIIQLWGNAQKCWRSIDGIDNGL